MLDQVLQQSNSWMTFLITNTFYALLLAGFVVFLKLLYPKLPKRVEYGLWCIVLIRLIIPLDLSFNYAIPGMVRGWLFSLDATQELSGFFSSSSGLRGINQQTSEQSIPLVDTVYVIWLGIVALVFSSYLVLRFKLLQMLSRSHPIVEYPIIACVNRWRLNFWIKGPVHVIALDKYVSPFTFFFKAPIIFIPRRILESNNDTLIESIIAHEMAHVKRLDSLWLVLQNFIQILYFFNPLVWVVVRRMSALRESLCDEMVLSAKQVNPAEYGESLLKVLRFNISGEIQAGLSNAFLGYKGQIKRRVADIGNYSFSPSRPKLEICWVFAFAVFFLPFTHQVAEQQEVPSEKVIWKKDDNSPFPKYIEEQVRLPVVGDED